MINPALMEGRVNHTTTTMELSPTDAGAAGDLLAAIVK
jgi:hypothetical protein